MNEPNVLKNHIITAITTVWKKTTIGFPSVGLISVVLSVSSLTHFLTAVKNFLSHLSVVMMNPSNANARANGMKKIQGPIEVSPSIPTEADCPSIKITLRASIGEMLSSEITSLA